MWSYYDWVIAVFRQETQYVVVLWLGCRCLSSINTICGRIMIRLSLSSVSKHNMWSSHIMLTDGRQQRQPNHNTTIYCVNRRKTTTTRPSVNTICGRIMIGLSLLSSVNKHTMWSYYDCIYCCFRSSLNTICGHIMIGLSLLLSISKHNMWWYTTTTINPIIIRPHIVFTDGRQ
jgi:hypothetical protein